MSRRSRMKIATLTLLLTGVFGTAGAHAAPYEPNDGFLQAYGPLNGGQDYDGAIETTPDVDWFYFNTAGQRQFDISLTQVAGDCHGAELYNDDGYSISGAYTDFEAGRVKHILWTAPNSRQYALRVGGYVGCQYRVRIDPADAITTASPGIVASLGGNDEAEVDDVQRVLVDGRLVGTVQGDAVQTFTLGNLAPSSRITFEAENTSDDDWSWEVTITKQTGRAITTLFTESRSGSGSGRVGVVRRVVLSTSGNPLESCGEAFAPVTCIPLDADGDGFTADRDCNDADRSIRPDAPEILDNPADENCDGVAARRVRQTTKLSVKRRGKRYRGRLSSSGADCVARRRIVLRRKGTGTRAFATTYTRKSGSFSIKLPVRLRRSVYVVAAGSTTAASKCRSARSRPIRG